MAKENKGTDLEDCFSCVGSIGINARITILARRPRGLRAKINLASKEMSVIFGCVTFGLDSGVARVCQVKIDSLQNAFYFRLFSLYSIP